MPPNAPYIGDEIGQQSVDVGKGIHLLNPFHVPMMTLRRMVVIEYAGCRYLTPLEFWAVAGTLQMTSSRILPSSSTTFSRRMRLARGIVNSFIWHSMPYIGSDRHSRGGYLPRLGRRCCWTNTAASALVVVPPAMPSTRRSTSIGWASSQREFRPRKANRIASPTRL